MKGGQFIELGYDPAYHMVIAPPPEHYNGNSAPRDQRIHRHVVLEGRSGFDLLIEGVGFVGNSVVRVDNVSLPTTFINPRLIKASISPSFVKSATPNPFDAPGPKQHGGVFGDPAISISVYNPPPEGGTSNDVSLAIRAKWMGSEEKLP